MVLNISAVKDAIRARYAWPGGYPLYLLCADGEALHTECARANWREVVTAMRDSMPDDWQIVAADINWEDKDLQCAHCGNVIESAYG